MKNIIMLGLLVAGFAVNSVNANVQDEAIVAALAEEMREEAEMLADIEAAELQR